jgi:hypothetical protein
MEEATYPDSDDPRGRPALHLDWFVQDKMKRVRAFLLKHLSVIFSASSLGLIVWREWQTSAPFKTSSNLRHWLVLVFLVASILYILWFLLSIILVRSRVRKSTLVCFSTITVVTAFVAANNLQRLLAFLNLHGFELLILIATAATAASAVWEVRGDKLSSSRRDNEFAMAVRESIRQLDYMWKEGGRMPPEEFRQVHEQFLDWVITRSCAALCGRKKVHGGLLVKPLDQDGFLSLDRCSVGAPYDKDLKVALPGPGRKAGAAGVAFTLGRRAVVYVRDHATRKAWKYEWKPEIKDYWMSKEPEEAWTTNLNDELFTSSLSVPVLVYGQNKSITTVGVLVFSARAWDAFFEKDYLMAECFAHIISQALLVRRMVEQQRRNKQGKTGKGPKA